MSAFSVVTPRGDRLLGVERAEPDVHQRAPSARCASRSAGPSSRPRPPPTAPRRCRARSCWSRSRRPACPRRRPARGAARSGAGRPRSRPCPGSSGMFGCEDMPVASTSCFGPQRRPPAPSRSTTTVHSSPSKDARLHGRGAPVVELHHLRVHLEPVADLVLGREHRPVLGELDVRQVVVPDRVVQAERLVALAPGVAGTLVALDDDRRHAELAQPRAERDPALPAADDHDVGLRLVAELVGLLLALLEPGEPVARRAVLDALRPARALGLLVALELVERRSAASTPCRRAAADARCPRPAAVSNAIHASVTPVGLRRAARSCASRAAARARACASSMSSTPAGPSTVLMFQVNATRSRQKLSSANSSAAAAPSPAASASSKLPSQTSTAEVDGGIGHGLSPPAGTWRGHCRLRGWMLACRHPGTGVVNLAGTPRSGSRDAGVGRHASGSPLCRADQHGQPHPPGFLNAPGQSADRAGLRGQADLEGRAAARGVGRRDRAAVAVDDPGDDRQAEARRRPCRARARPRRARSARTARRRRRPAGPGPWSRTSQRDRAVVALDRDLDRRARRACGRARCAAGWRAPGAAGRRRRSTPRPASACSAISRSGAVARASSTASRASTARSTGPCGAVAHLVQARERQQVLDEHAHARGLVLDPAHRLRDVLGLARGAHAEQLGVAADRDERRAQLVRRVGDEAAQPLLARLARGERVLEPVEHAVERDAEAADLGARVGRLDAVREVAAGDRGGGVAHAVQRQQADAHDDRARSRRAARARRRSRCPRRAAAARASGRWPTAGSRRRSTVPSGAGLGEHAVVALRTCRPSRARRRRCPSGRSGFAPVSSRAEEARSSSTLPALSRRSP